ncbi:Sensor histidine kinase QseE (fragment) [mine drainage metagenome]|uniref:histidine kinase n=1 Tax=mine drainage metagenome TaxID=410659 RepID=A0A3P3ZPB0_9ZZZZ
MAGNLLINAIRFSPVSGLIRLTLSEGSEGWKMMIQDQGPGVDPQDALHIFDPFYQGKRQPAGARKGSGVGLSIVRALVQAHGGGVSLIPQDNGVGGAVFCVEMPRDTGETGGQRSKGSKDRA